MIAPLIGLLGVGIVLIVSELMWRKKQSRGELARKFVHIIVGTFMASWLFFMTQHQVQFLSVVLVIGVVLSKKLSIFQSVHEVNRKTWGEVLFAASIGVTATLTNSPWIYAAAILNMSLADGLAAVVGTKFGGTTGYSVFGQHKTLVGTLTFFVTSCIITVWVVMGSNSGFGDQTWLIALWLPLLATVTENIAVSGLDNIAVPLVVVASLEFVQKIY